MKRILFLPFLQLSSGHYQVCRSLEAWMKIYQKPYQCERIDIFSYAFGKIESLISQSYLHAIQYLPSVYSWIYRKNVIENDPSERYVFYDLLFEKAMLRLIDEKKPDWLICTHALPSYILNRLKQKQKVHARVVNVYTDYVIHNLWGKEGIDYHLVPDLFFKEQLVKNGVEHDKIFATGIPIHPSIKRTDDDLKPSETKLNILITGGNLGIGKMDSMIKNLRPSSALRYYVLCGKNKRLYDTLKEKMPYVTPLPYIESPDEINQLYNRMHGIVTKPGGVTVTESLSKRLPIFIYHTLPGQEEMNLQYLLSNELAYDLRGVVRTGKASEVIQAHLLSKNKMQQYRKKVEIFHQRVSTKHLAAFIDQIG